jgi:hypothetical protein
MRAGRHCSDDPVFVAGHDHLIAPGRLELVAQARPIRRATSFSRILLVLPIARVDAAMAGIDHDDAFVFDSAATAIA